MFSPSRYRCGIDRVRKTWKIGTNGDEEGSKALPVDTIVVSVASVWIVESWYVDVTALDQPVIGCDDAYVEQRQWMRQ